MMSPGTNDKSVVEIESTKNTKDVSKTVLKFIYPSVNPSIIYKPFYLFRVRKVKKTY